MILLGPRKAKTNVSRSPAEQAARRVRGARVAAALAMFLECIRDVGEWVREG